MTWPREGPANPAARQGLISRPLLSGRSLRSPCIRCDQKNLGPASLVRSLFGSTTTASLWTFAARDHLRLHPLVSF